LVDTLTEAIWLSNLITLDKASRTSLAMDTILTTKSLDIVSCTDDEANGICFE
jgi:hypothetical protein